MDELHALHDGMRDRSAAMLDLLARTVSIDSGSYDGAGVNAVIDLFERALIDAGFSTTRTTLPGWGDKFRAERRLGGTGRLLILGHADTVWPAGTAAAWPFANDGIHAIGPGVGDMKAAVTMAIHAVSLLLERGFDALERIVFLIVPDEEIGSLGSRAWIEAEAKQADWVLTLEPARPGGGVVTGRGCIGALILNATGISAHAGVNRAVGASAIRALAEAVPAMEGLSSGSRAVTVGILRGGAARQVVPHEAEAHVDLRGDTTQEVEALMTAIDAIVAHPADPRVSIVRSGGITRPGFPRSVATALYAQAAEVAAALDIPIFEVNSRGGSDGCFSAALGIPTLDGLGPICHDTCSRQERIEVASIADRGALMAGLIMRLRTSA